MNPNPRFSVAMTTDCNLTRHFPIRLTIPEVNLLNLRLKIRIRKLRFFLQKFPHRLRHQLQSLHIEFRLHRTLGGPICLRGGMIGSLLGPSDYQGSR